MEQNLNIKHETIIKALATLAKAIKQFHRIDSVDARNASSHRYKAEMAIMLAQHIPHYYALMHTIVTRHTTIAPTP